MHQELRIFMCVWIFYKGNYNVRPRDWQPRRSDYKIPLRVMRVCLLGMILPSILIIGPLYLRHRVYSEQLYPLAMSDQRLIDGKVSTIWCQVR